MSSIQNSATFERIVRPHFDRLYRLAWRLAGSKAEAEDLFQELLIKAYQKLDVLVEIDDPKTGRTEAYWDGGFMGNPARAKMKDQRSRQKFPLIPLPACAFRTPCDGTADTGHHRGDNRWLFFYLHTR